MGNDGAQAFYEIFRSKLRFLEAEWQFSRHEVPSEVSWITHLVYVYRDIALDFEFEGRELSVDESICRWSLWKQRYSAGTRSVYLLAMFPELAPRHNAEVARMTKDINRLQSKALKTGEISIIREWLSAEADRYAFWLRAAGREEFLRRAASGLAIELPTADEG